MIVVKVSTNGITIDGHAGYAETGKDIVCSATSVLVQNLINSVEALTNDSIQYQMQSGHIDITYKNLSKKGKLLVDSFFIGISGISRAYPDYVQII